MVTPPHVPVPFSDSLEDSYIPNAAKVEAAVQSVVGHRVAAAAR
jgi:pyruvate dehydrogenase E1 component beta subunit